MCMGCGYREIDVIDDGLVWSFGEVCGSDVGFVGNCGGLWFFVVVFVLRCY